MQADNHPNVDGWDGAHLDEGRVHAWLDGALDGAEAAAAERHTESCSRCAAMVADARGLIAASSRILGALDDERTGVVGDARASVTAAFAPAGELAGPPRDSGRGLKVEHGGKETRASGGGALKGAVTPRRFRADAWQWRVAAAVLIVAGASALLLSNSDPTEFLETPRSESAPMSVTVPDSVAGAAAVGGASVAAESDLTPQVAPESALRGFVRLGEPAATVRLPEAAAGSTTRERSATAPAAPPPPTAAPVPVPTPPISDATGAMSERQARGDSGGQPPSPTRPPVALSEVAPTASLQGKAAAPPAQTAERAGDRAMTSEIEPLADAAPPAVLRGEVRSAADRQPVAGATVHVTGAPAGVLTDSAGRFALPVAVGDTLARVYASGFAPALLVISDSLLQDSALVLLQREAGGLAEPGVPADAQAAMLEAWLAPDVEHDDDRVVGLAGCWALVGGRVPGASDGLVLRLHAEHGGERTWRPVDVEAEAAVDSVLVRLAGAAELRLERQGDRLAGVSWRGGPTGTPGIPVEFARVRCEDSSVR